MNVVEFISVNKSFDTLKVLNNLSFSINEGEIVAFLGVNGSGKSTIFNLINGIIKPNSGVINTKYQKEEIAFLQQNYRDYLLPWKTNYQNLTLPLTIQGLNKENIHNAIEELNDVIDLNLDLNAYPYQLSGGQQQKLAIFRSLITKPKILCLDEPFSALDIKIRKEISEMILKYWVKEKATVCLITHDIDEALLLTNRIFVVSNVGEKDSLVLDKCLSLPQPRNTLLMATSEYNLAKKEVLNCLGYE
jgi:NitT/TauT family transport system ATP-binding protein